MAKSVCTDDEIAPPTVTLTLSATEAVSLYRLAQEGATHLLSDPMTAAMYLGDDTAIGSATTALDKLDAVAWGPAVAKARQKGRQHA